MSDKKKADKRTRQLSHIKWSNKHTKRWVTSNNGRYTLIFDSDDLLIPKMHIDGMINIASQHIDAYFVGYLKLKEEYKDLSIESSKTRILSWREDSGYYYKVEFTTNDPEMPESIIDTLLQETKNMMITYLYNRALLEDLEDQ